MFHREVIIPTFDYGDNEPCTAILNLNQLEWRKLEGDNRKNVLATTTAQAYRYVHKWCENNKL